MNENTTTGIISNTTGSLFVRIEVHQNGPLNGPLTVHWWCIGRSGPLADRTRPEKSFGGPKTRRALSQIRNFAKAFYEADFYANEQAGEQVDYVDVGYDWAEIRANCTLFTQLVQKVSGTQEMISAGPFKMVSITGNVSQDLT